MLFSKVYLFKENWWGFLYRMVRLDEEWKNHKSKVREAPTEQKVKDALNEEKTEQEIEDFKENEINWLDGDFWDSWDLVKGHMKKLWGHKKPYDEDIKWKKFLLAHSKDQIIGKPLLIQNTKVKLPLVKQSIKKIKDEETEEEIEIQSFHILGEKFDRRYDGYQKEAYALDFYKYRIETVDDKEIYIFSEKKLPSGNCLLKGMLIELDDFSEMSRTMKIPSLSRFFFPKEIEPAVKTLEKNELVKFVKGKGITEESWLRHLVSHPFGTINNFPLESEILNSAQLLCGKFDGWPLPVCYVGPQGTRKTMGKGETTEFLFGEEKIMVDSGNARLKGLTPSYKGTITKPGYLAEQDRIAIVDELGKMVEAESKKHDTVGTNILGEFNSILEHKDRLAVSGNTSTSNMKPTAKDIFIMNPVSNRERIGDHVGPIDSTVMSRILWWVQDEEEQKFVLGIDGILRESPLDLHKTTPTQENPPKTFTSILNWNMVIENRKREILLKKSRGRIERDTFLTIYDSCYSFISLVCYDKVQAFVDMITNLSKEPMKGIWKPRGFHHVILLVDGICKQRCLFRDYDASFTAKQEDYDLAERVLIRMVKGWDTNLQPKEDYNNGYS